MNYYDLLCNMCFSQHVASFGTWCQQLQKKTVRLFLQIQGLHANLIHRRLRRVSGGKAWRRENPRPSPLLPPDVASGSHCDRQNSTPATGLEVARNAIYFAQVLTCLHVIPCAIFNTCDISPGYQNTEYIHFDTFLADSSMSILRSAIRMLFAALGLPTATLRGAEAENKGLWRRDVVERQLPKPETSTDAGKTIETVSKNAESPYASWPEEPSSSM